MWPWRTASRTDVHPATTSDEISRNSGIEKVAPHSKSPSTRLFMLAIVYSLTSCRHWCQSASSGRDRMGSNEVEPRNPFGNAIRRHGPLLLGDTDCLDRVRNRLHDHAATLRPVDRTVKNDPSVPPGPRQRCSFSRADAYSPLGARSSFVIYPRFLQSSIEDEAHQGRDGERWASRCVALIDLTLRDLDAPGHALQDRSAGDSPSGISTGKTRAPWVAAPRRSRESRYGYGTSRFARCSISRMLVI